RGSAKGEARVEQRCKEVCSRVARPRHLELIAARDAHIELVAARNNKVALADESVGLFGVLMATNDRPGAESRQQCRCRAADEDRQQAICWQVSVIRRAISDAPFATERHSPV